MYYARLYAERFSFRPYAGHFTILVIPRSIFAISIIFFAIYIDIITAMLDADALLIYFVCHYAAASHY